MEPTSGKMLDMNWIPQALHEARFPFSTRNKNKTLKGSFMCLSLKGQFTPSAPPPRAFVYPSWWLIACYTHSSVLVVSLGLKHERVKKPTDQCKHPELPVQLSHAGDIPLGDRSSSSGLPVRREAVILQPNHYSVHLILMLLTVIQLVVALIRISCIKCPI